MICLQASALRSFAAVAAALVDSGGGVALPCAYAKRSRLLLLPEVFDNCSSFGCRLSPRDRPIIRELNETVFAVHFLETGGTGYSESCERWGTPCCPTTCHHQHFTVFIL